MEELVISDRLKKLKDEVLRLRMVVAALQQEKSDLELNIIPALRVEYMEKIGNLINRIKHQEIMVRELKFRIALVQAALNRAQKVSEEEVNEKVDEEYQEYREKVKEEEEKAAREKSEQENTEHKRAENEARYNEKKQHGEQTAAGGKTSADADGTGNPEEQTGKDGKDAGEHDDPSVKGKGYFGNKAAGGRIGEAGSSQDESEDKKPEDEFAGMDIKQKVKELYRRIVKKLHPDMNPNVTERQKELWNMAQKAYKEWDVETLEKIYDEINEVSVEEMPDTEETLEELEKMLEKLKNRRRELINEIEKLKSEFPYTEKSLLENEEAVAKIQEELNAKIKEYEEIITMLGERLAELNKKMQETEDRRSE